MKKGQFCKVGGRLMLEREQENNWIVNSLFSFNTDWLLEYYDLRLLHITCPGDSSTSFKQFIAKEDQDQTQHRSSNIIQSSAESKSLDAGLHQVVNGILHLQHHYQFRTIMGINCQGAGHLTSRASLLSPAALTIHPSACLASTPKLASLASPMCWPARPSVKL